MQIEIQKGDITKLDVDAIVNAANFSLLGGGGVDGAVHKAAGPELLEECRSFNGCEIGNAVITKGYRLPAEYVIHTPGPVWHGGSSNEQISLQNCYYNSLRLAEEHSLKVIAFPCISTGIYRFPAERAAAIAVKTVKDWERAYPEKVIFCTFSDKDYKIYCTLLAE